MEEHINKDTRYTKKKKVNAAKSLETREISTELTLH